VSPLEVTTRYHLQSREQPSPDTKPAGALRLDFPDFRTMGNKLLLLINYQSVVFCDSNRNKDREIASRDNSFGKFCSKES
jgi:hypothetical protein